jgi:hypothetical protein
MRRSAALLLALAAALAPAPASSQEPEAPPAGEADDAAPATSAREEFELNIADRRITEEDFAASTAVEIRTGQGGEGLAVRVGALVGARRIDVRLRNVQGRVRFIASLERVQQVVDSHRVNAAAR